MFIIPANYSTPSNYLAPSNYSAPADHSRAADHSAPSNIHARQMYQPRHFPPLICLPYRQPIQHRQVNHAQQIDQYRCGHTVIMSRTETSSAVRYQHANRLIQPQHIANTKASHCQRSSHQGMGRAASYSSSFRPSSAASSRHLRPHTASRGSALLLPHRN